MEEINRVVGEAVAIIGRLWDPQRLLQKMPDANKSVHDVQS